MDGADLVPLRAVPENLRPIVAPEISLTIECDRINAVWRDAIRGKLEAVHESYGVRTRIQIEYVGNAVIPFLDPASMTDCEADVLDVITEAAPRKPTRRKIIEALESSGRIHGESTIGLALKSLFDKGKITRPRPGSRDGYGKAPKKRKTARTPAITGSATVDHSNDAE